MALEPARRGGADWFPETIRQSVPRPSKRQDRVLIGHSLESKSQEWSVSGCYLDVKVSVFQIHRQKPVLRAYLHEDLFQIQHSERLSHEGLIQMPKIENWSEPADLYWERGSIDCRSLTCCSLRSLHSNLCKQCLHFGTRVSLSCTEVCITPLNTGSLRTKWSEKPHSMVFRTQSDTPGVAFQPAARRKRLYFY